MTDDDNMDDLDFMVGSESSDDSSVNMEKPQDLLAGDIQYVCNHIHCIHSCRSLADNMREIEGKLQDYLKQNPNADTPQRLIEKSISFKVR